MTKKEFEEKLLDKLTLSFRRKLPEGGKIEFYANPKKFHEEVTEEKKAFWDETRAWISGNGPAPENTVIDYPDSIQAAMRDGLWEPEVRDLALTLLKSLSNTEFFKADRIGAKDLKEMGWDFERYLAGNLKRDTPDHRTTVPESFARGAVKAFPEEAEAWTKETLKGEPVFALRLLRPQFFAFGQQKIRLLSGTHKLLCAIFLPPHLLSRAPSVAWELIKFTGFGRIKTVRKK